MTLRSDQKPIGSPATPAPDKVVENRKWTVMVFMGADTISGSAPLQDAARADLAEMESVMSGAGTEAEWGGELNVFVEVHGLDSGLGKVRQRRHVGKGDPKDHAPYDASELAGGRALESFITWALTTAKPDYSMLVLWGHSYDFAFGRERRRDGTIDALDFAELSDALKRLQERFGAKDDDKLDILGFDACDLATVEMAYQLRPFAKYLLGSQIGIPIPGWPYDRILDRLRNPKGEIMSPAEFGSYAVRRFCEAYPPTRPVSLTMLDLKRAPELFEHVNELARSLVSTIEDSDSLTWLSQLFQRSQTDEDRPYVDLADLCLSLRREGGDADANVIQAAGALGDFLLSPRPPLVGRGAEGTGRPFVVEHGRNAGHTARLNGISIYAPHVAPGIDFEAARPLYHKLAFTQETDWSDIVHALARLSGPAA